MPLHIGTSGWHYADWRERFYPPGLPARAWLEHYSRRFETVELNNAFYRLPEAATFVGWASQTPDDFILAVKASRYLTHVRRLREPAPSVALLLGRCQGLGPKLGPVLLQLPPTLQRSVGALDETLASFPPGVRVAVEPRHPSWFVPEVEDLLRRYRAALCWSDRRGPLTPLWRTADWGYLRFHQGQASPSPCYGRMALESWARRLAERFGPTEDVFSYFNNDTWSCAPRDAAVLGALCRRAGLVVKRVPPAGEIRVGQAVADASSGERG
ncbi:MAG: DUF72 domain-containing protein [Acidimicrobiales bacterium]|nr:DUF72 domain-containing protein [Acidimicrobiales bacterium]